MVTKSAMASKREREVEAKFQQLRMIFEAAVDCECVFPQKSRRTFLELGKSVLALQEHVAHLYALLMDDF